MLSTGTIGNVTNFVVSGHVIPEQQGITERQAREQQLVIFLSIPTSWQNPGPSKVPPLILIMWPFICITKIVLVLKQRGDQF